MNELCMFYDLGTSSVSVENLVINIFRSYLDTAKVFNLTALHYELTKVKICAIYLEKIRVSILLDVSGDLDTMAVNL